MSGSSSTSRPGLYLLVFFILLNSCQALDIVARNVTVDPWYERWVKWGDVEEVIPGEDK